MGLAAGVGGWGKRDVYRDLFGEGEGKGQLARPRRRWEDNIRMNFKRSGIGDVNWIRLVLDRNKCQAIVKTVMNTSGCIKC
jgi:hypothetical protein